MRRICTGSGLALLIGVLGFACGETPPEDVLKFHAEPELCVPLALELEPTPSDPHKGFKNIYACHITEDELAALDPIVYPDGTLIIKTSHRGRGDDDHEFHQQYDWLLATARKSAGAWEWTEYKRNFENEDFLDIPVSQDVCVDCHKKAFNDFIHLEYTAR